jgi:hypothetical protein
VKASSLLQRHLPALPFEAAMLTGAVLTYIDKDWVHFGISISTFIASFTPLLVEKALRIKLPAVYQFIFVAFVFFSMFCGEVLYTYRDVRGWDATIHVISGALIALGFVLWIRYLIRQKKVRFTSWYQAFFVVACGIMAAAVWELVEFGSDRLFGANSQDGSLYDTMTDLLYGTMGTIILAALYELYLRKKQAKFLGRLIDAFERLNRIS